MMTLTPQLGDFRLQNETVPARGAGNSTRWIIDVQQHRTVREPPIALRELSPTSAVLNREVRPHISIPALAELGADAVEHFYLIRNRQVVVPQLISFHFGALSDEMYDARPWLHFDEETGRISLHARDVEAAYQLSIDIMHSMHR